MVVFHTPVLLNECLEYLAPEKPNALMVDATLGEGGHSYAFLSKFPDIRIYGLDADCEIQKRAEERLQKFGDRIKFFNVWSDDFFKTNIEKSFDIILIDLGISVFHYSASNRGFSFSRDETLDMRLNANTGKSAGDLIANLSEKDLADIIFKFGEERYSRRIARKIVERRKTKAITSSKDLADIIFNAVPPKYRYGRLHPATRTFQALRIEVNSELERLPKLLELAFESLAEGGKLGVISFHSLEDRIVKHYFRTLSKTFVEKENMPIQDNGENFLATLLTKKPIQASEEEVRANSPSRSAKLRVIKKNIQVTRKMEKE
ncbi:MAG: 16S rRNA (cytosine(1402)-N(4))-methyltransferase RsmH [Treponemataceae bacterium]